MPVQVEWDTPEKQAIHYAFIERWTWDELNQAIERGEAMMAEAQRVVGLFLDFRESMALPPNPMAQTRKLLSRQHPYAGVRVFIGANELIRMLWNMFNRLYSLVIREQNTVFLFANSIEEARELLAEKQLKN
jgi:hypothetical protein